MNECEHPQCIREAKWIVFPWCIYNSRENDVATPQKAMKICDPLSHGWSDSVLRIVIE